ncbi:hypothetical protein Sango_0097100 [Sesamum angolense]|uniref:Uncharacterized protein n=1 Tax=Sesamum angolense TaxID=2727404 RepID=A0AAE2C5Y7_9LAMI|nr:hypothetical protein Sango_0097100 [Sesamum angolense]
MMSCSPLLCYCISFSAPSASPKKKKRSLFAQTRFSESTPSVADLPFSIIVGDWSNSRGYFLNLIFLKFQMSNYDGIGSHSQSQSNSSPNVQTVNIDGLQNHVTCDLLENVDYHFDDNIDKELEREDEEEDTLGWFKEHEAISRIREAIRYIRNSPARYKKFQECVEFEKLKTKKLLSLYGPTRWNFTYLMLETAISLKIAFDASEDVDHGYQIDLSR